MGSLIVWAAVAVTMVGGYGRPAAKLTGATVDEVGAARFATVHQLPLPVGVRERVFGLVRVREAKARQFGWVGLGVGIALGVLAHVTGYEGLTGLLVMIPVGLGLTVGGCRGAQAQHPSSLQDAERIAHPRAVEVADYTTPQERTALLVSVGTVLVSLITSAVIWWLVPVRPKSGGWVLGAFLAAFMVVIAAVAWVWQEVTRVVETSQQASTELELAWSDALRADAVRDLIDAGVGLGMVAVLAILATAANWVLPSSVRSQGMIITAQLGMTALLVGVLCWSVVLAVWLPGRTRKNPSTKLWTAQGDEGAL